MYNYQMVMLIEREVNQEKTLLMFLVYFYNLFIRHEIVTTPTDAATILVATES